LGKRRNVLKKAIVSPMKNVSSVVLWSARNRVRTGSNWGVLLCLSTLLFSLCSVLFPVFGNAQVKVEAISGAQDATPGDFVTHTFQVTNQQAVTDTFSIALQPSTGLTSLTAPPPLTLDPGASETIFVTVLVNPNAQAGENSITLVATSQTDATIKGGATATINVRPVVAFQIIAPPDTQAIPGERVELSFTLVNQGNSADEFNLSERSTRGFTTKLSLSSAALLPGEQVEVVVGLIVPIEIQPGIDRVVLTVASTLSPTLIGSATAVVNVLPLPPRSVQGSLFLQLPVQFDLAFQRLADNSSSKLPFTINAKGALRDNLRFSLLVQNDNALQFGNPAFSLGLFLDQLPIFFSRSSISTALPPLQLGAVVPPGSSVLSLQITPQVRNASFFNKVVFNEHLKQLNFFSLQSRLLLRFSNFDLRFGLLQTRLGSDNNRSISAALSVLTGLVNTSVDADLSTRVVPLTIPATLFQVTTQFNTQLNTQLAFGQGLPTLHLSLSDNIVQTSSKSFSATTVFPGVGEVLARSLRVEQTVLSVFNFSFFAEETQKTDPTVDKVRFSRVGAQLSVSLDATSFRLRHTQNRTEQFNPATHQFELISGSEAQEEALELTFRGELGVASLSVRLQSDGTLSVGARLNTQFLSNNLTSVVDFRLVDGNAPVLSFGFTFSTLFNLTVPIATKARVEGVVFVDKNNNGKLDDDEEGVPNLILTLGDFQALSDEQDPGFFRFPPVKPGIFALDISSLPVSLKAAIPLPIKFSLEAGQTGKVVIPLIRLGLIKGVVFNDVNQDGQRDPGEGGVKDVRVLLRNNNIDPERELHTTASGSYSFADLDAGEYTVVVDAATLPERFEFTTDPEVVLKVESGQQVTLDFGVAKRPVPIRFVPTADFTFQPDAPNVGQKVRFDASSSFDIDGEVVKFEWDFDGDGTVDARGSVVEHAFEQPGTFHVRLTVTDNDGQPNTTSKVLVVSGA